MNSAGCMTITLNIVGCQDWHSWLSQAVRVTLWEKRFLCEGFFAFCRSVDGANQYLADDVSGGSSVGIYFKGGKTNRGTR